MKDHPKVKIPQELRKVLKLNGKVPIFRLNKKEKEYLDLINLIVSKKSIDWAKEEHLNMLEILIYMENFYSQEEMKKHSMKEQKLNLNKENCFEIDVSDLDDDDPFITKHDYVLLNDNELRIIEVKSKMVIAKPEEYIEFKFGFLI